MNLLDLLIVVSVAETRAMILLPSDNEVTLKGIVKIDGHLRVTKHKKAQTLCI